MFGYLHFIRADPLQARLTYELSKNGTVTAMTSEEAQILLTLAKCASFGEESHAWYSYDGRELGTPTVKTFDFSYRIPSSLVDNYVNFDAVDNVNANTSQQEEFLPKMKVVVNSSGKLRVRFKLSEIDK